MTGDEPRQDREIRVQQLAGPGVPGLDHDPPVYHFDLATEMMPDLMADPVEFLRRIGLGPEQGVAPKGAMAVRLTDAEWLWDGTRWISREDQPQKADNAGVPSTSCCYISGPAEMTCHTHAPEVV
jgi:hypothetical protein